MLMVISAPAKPARAVWTITMQQVGSDVEATGTGSMDYNGYIPIPNGSADSGLDAPIGQILLGAYASNTTNFDPISISDPPNFGPGGPGGVGEVSPSSIHGFTAGVLDSGEDGGGGQMEIVAPFDYVSGTPFSSSATWADWTLAGLGITPGTYTWTWQTTPTDADPATSDSIILDIIAPPPTPEPAALAVCSVPAAMGVLRRRRV
jgi:hypothetical protein